MFEGKTFREILQTNQQTEKSIASLAELITNLQLTFCTHKNNDAVPLAFTTALSAVSVCQQHMAGRGIVNW